MSSVQFDQTSTTDQGIDHTSNVPAQTAFTAVVLMRINTYADWGDPLTLSNDNGGNHRYHGLEFDAAGNLYHHRNANTNVPNYGAVNLWTDSYTGWAWIALSVDGTTQNAYYMRPGGSFTTATSLPINLSITPARLSIGRQPIFGTTDTNGVVQFGAIIVYDAVLTATEIQRQMVANTRKPIRWDNLNFWNDCLSNSSINVDQTGKKGNWTTTGSPSSSTQDPGAAWDISGPGLYLASSSSTAQGAPSSAPSDSFAAVGAMLKAGAASSTPAITAGATGASLAAAAASSSPAITVGATGARLAAGAPSCAPALTVGATGVTSHANFPLVVESNGRYLKTAGGTPFRIQGDAAWDMIVNLSLSELRTFLDDRLGRGVNALVMQITDPVKYDAGSNAPANDAGDKPFLLNTSGTSWNGDPTFANHDAAFSSPNPAYFAWVDTVLSEMATRGMLAILDYNYMGFNNGASDGWWQTLTNAGNTQAVCFAFGQYLGGRYKLYGNIMWKTGTDMFPTAASEGETRHLKILQGIQDAEGASLKLVTGHWKASSTATDEANFASLMMVNAAYAHGDYSGSNWHNTHARCRVGYNAALGPVFLVESVYENGTTVTEHSATRQQLRSAWYGAALSAIGGVCMGNGDVWQFTSAALSSNLNSNGAQDFERMGDLLDAVAWNELVPNGLGSIGTLVTAGGGTIQSAGSAGSNDGNNGTDYVVAAATPSGKWLIAYVPHGHSGSVTIDMSKLSGQVLAKWYDPSNGSYSTIGTYSNTGTRAFTTTGTNSAGDNDWILLLEGQSQGDPSSAPSDSFAATGKALFAGVPSSAPAITVGATGARLGAGDPSCAPSLTAAGTSQGGSAAESAPDITVGATGASLAAGAPSAAPSITVGATGSPLGVGVPSCSPSFSAAAVGAVLYAADAVSAPGITVGATSAIGPRAQSDPGITVGATGAMLKAAAASSSPSINVVGFSSGGPGGVEDEWHPDVYHQGWIPDYYGEPS